jgi:hypothetical protein
MGNRARARLIRQELLNSVMGETAATGQFRRYRIPGCASSARLRLVPDTQAHTHDGQRPRDRSYEGWQRTA